MSVKAHELDDGTREAVSLSPRRTPPVTASTAEAAAVPVGGKMARMRLSAASKRQEFTMIRAPLGAAKIALGHLAVFDTLWRLWAAKRVTGADPGVTVAEVAEATSRPVGAIRTVLTTLIRNGIVRSTRTNVGFANVRARFFPTELGTQVLAMAQMLGPGASVQIGRTPTAWRSRAADEPANFFQHAALISGTA